MYRGQTFARISKVCLYVCSCDMAQVVASAQRPTNQSGGVTSGPGGSANAVNGYFSQSAVDATNADANATAAADPFFYFGSASSAAAGPWWVVDLGAALPLAFVEVTAAPATSDGLGLQVS